MFIPGSANKSRTRTPNALITGFYRAVIPVVVVLATLAVFYPVLRNNFVNWDDDWSLLENTSYRGLSWAQLHWMFTTFHTGHYQPLSWATLGLDYLLWGMNPRGYHLTSLVLHALNALLFYLVALRLLSAAIDGGAALPGRQAGIGLAAAFAALLFAIHPLRVESVAWATERRDVLSGFFLLATVLLYLRAVKGCAGASGPRLWMGAAVLSYAASLLSKASGMTLPVVLLILDVFPLARLGKAPDGWLGTEARRVWVEKIPFFILAVGAGTVALVAQNEAGALRSVEYHGVPLRAALSVFSAVFYLWKTLFPLPLAPLYAIPVDVHPLDWSFVFSGIVVVAVSLLLYRARRRWPAGLTAWLVYLALLFPVSGIAQSGPHLAADRYTYLSCMGWAVLASAGLLHCWRAWVAPQIRAGRLLLISSAACLIVVVLSVLTWRQVQVWHDSETLWKHAISAGAESALAHNNLGKALFEHGESERAIGHFREAVGINSQYAIAHANLGEALAARGDLEEATRHFQKAVEIESENAAFQSGLGLALARRGKLKEASKHLHRALELNPADAGTRNNLGNVLAMSGEFREAVEQFRRALELNPGFSGARFNLAMALVREGNLQEAKSHFEQSLQTEPDSAEAHFYLGNIVAFQGDIDRAADHFREAVRLQPGFAMAHEALGRALTLAGKENEAKPHFEKAAELLRSRR